MTDNVISQWKDFRDIVGIELGEEVKLDIKLGEEVNAVPSVPWLAKNWSRFRPKVENGPILL